MRLVAALLVLVLCTGCGPWGRIPGGRLRGEEVANPVTDWSFATHEKKIQVETRTNDPHSVTTGCVVFEHQLYVPAAHPTQKQWVMHVLVDPRVRVRVRGQVHPRKAKRVIDPLVISAVDALLVDKYRLPDDHAAGHEVWFFRMDPP